MARKQKERIQAGADAVALYHIVYNHEGFEESAQALFKLIQRAQSLSPGKKRILYLDIEGHRNSDGSFDNDNDTNIFKAIAATGYVPNVAARSLMGSAAFSWLCPVRPIPTRVALPPLLYCRGVSPS